MDKLVCNTFEQLYAVPDDNFNIDRLDGTSTDVQDATNMFDHLDALPSPQSSDHHMELNCYLTADIEHITDAIAWWYEHHTVYPCLSRMVLDYPEVDLLVVVLVEGVLLV
ncbi:hypothetical protein SCLCIDRAFT_128197 [Scleroderma citrinum Foug A]|uniref:HAT C-terminal dimerisation domain-containing protein n=1 Tax=Scleroderma citrinum Foug A TaxID=1036808 RepID=A0A0C3DCJ6_9AGAM|nr:hypothetical protein SCLCIDRAFT_128197 [Scleroderma citrinum Foug A]